MRIADTWLNGAGRIGAATTARATSGLVIQRVVIRGFSDYGILSMAPSPHYRTDAPEIPPLVEDVDISGVFRVPRGSARGTAEDGIWIGTKSIVRRAWMRDIGWMGLWAGANTNGAIVSDVSISNVFKDSPDGTISGGMGLYIEHWTRDTVFRNFHIGPEMQDPLKEGFLMKHGIVTEWADPDYVNPRDNDPPGASHRNVLRDGIINSSCIGINMEDSTGSIIRNISFICQMAAAIKEFRTSGFGHDTTWETEENAFQSIGTDAVVCTPEHRPAC